MNDHDDRNEEPTESNEEERVSIWSVRPRVKNIFYTLFCTLVLGIIGMESLELAWMIDDEAVDSWLTWDKVRVVYRGLGEAAAPAIMVTVPATMAITEVVEFSMVLSQGLYNRFKREQEKTRREGFDKGLEKGREEGRQEGRLEAQTAIDTWNRQRLEAEARGETFDVPPPTFDDRE